MLDTTQVDKLVSTFIEVTLKDKSFFLKVKETLTRIGIASRKDKILYQSCHILHKKSKYYIVHFKELFALDGKPTNFSEEDKSRRDTIAKLLEEWNLVSIVNPSVLAGTPNTLMNVKVIPFKEKAEWNLVTKYDIGTKKAS